MRFGSISPINTLPTLSACRFAPIASVIWHHSEVTRRATSRLMHCSKKNGYSITSSATESTLSEILTPSKRSNRVGRCSL